MRCIMVVREIFRKSGVQHPEVKLGEVKMDSPISETIFRHVEKELHNAGFEIINDKAVQLVENIKTITINMIYQNQMPKKVNYSVYLAAQLNHNYNYISTLFSSIEGITIERYMINLKIERAKELLEYREKTLSEIAFEMGYSSVAHLSGQFKKVTGVTPSDYKKFKRKQRLPLNRL